MKNAAILFLVCLMGDLYPMDLSGDGKKELSISNKKKNSKNKKSSGKKNSGKKRYSKEQKRITLEGTDALRYASRSNGALTTSRKGDSYHIKRQKNEQRIKDLESKLLSMNHDIMQLQYSNALLQEAYKDKIEELESQIFDLQTFNEGVLKEDFKRVRLILRGKVDKDEVKEIAKQMEVFSEQLKRKKSKKMLVKKNSKIKIYHSSSTGMMNQDDILKEESNKEILESFSSSSPESIAHVKKQVLIRKDSVSSTSKKKK